MGLARVVLIATGLSFVAYGVWCWLDPAVVGKFTGIGLAGASAITEVQAMYGGLQVGSGLFLLLATWRRNWLVAGTWAVVLLMGGLALARSSAMWLHGPTDYNQSAVAFEALVAVLAIMALFALHQESVSPTRQ